MSEKHQSAGAANPSKATLDRNVDRACPRCMAPGKFGHDIRYRDGYSEAELVEVIAGLPEAMQAQAKIDIATQMRAGWPGCYVSKGDPRDGLPVRDVVRFIEAGDPRFVAFKGIRDICPNCGYARPEGEKQPQLEIEGGLI